MFFSPLAVMKKNVKTWSTYFFYLLNNMCQKKSKRNSFSLAVLVVDLR